MDIVIPDIGGLMDMSADNSVQMLDLGQFDQLLLKIGDIGNGTLHPVLHML